MVQVVIQPSFGNSVAWRHWEDTLDKEVAFAASPYVEALSASELDALIAHHPSGRARFWGATGNHDAKMARLRTGDVVLFTGQKHVRAVGEVGITLRNPMLADLLWDPHPERGSYQNVYTLLNFDQHTPIPYEEIWDLPGFNHGDNFMGLRFLDDEKSSTIIDGLHIRTATGLREVAEKDHRLAQSLGSGVFTGVEAVNAAESSYDRPATVTLVRRAEAVLVKAYRANLDGNAVVGRIRTASGVTDLYVESGAEVEIIEAKSSAHHGYVREALGQLLDYVLAAPRPVTRLSALFPERPADLAVSLLHRYGIDCLHLGNNGDFIRTPAPAEGRKRMQAVWSDPPADDAIGA